MSVQVKTFILDPDRIAFGLLQATDPVWVSNFGGGEPMWAGWQRLFGEPMPSAPLLFHCVEWQGRNLVVRLYPKGRVTMHDTAGGFEIRTKARKKTSEDLANAINHNRSRIDRAALRWIEQQ